MPEPTAVPPTGSSSTASARPSARAATAPICRAKPPISCPSRSGVASARWVRPILMISVPLLGLRRQRIVQPLQGRDQSLLDRHADRHVDRRGENVVGALPHVDVVVGVDRLSPAKRSPPASSIARLAITSLTFMLLEVPEPVWKTSMGNWSSNFPSATSRQAAQQGLDLSVVQRLFPGTGQLAQVAVGHGAGPLDQPQGMDQLRRKGARNGEILHGPLRLGAVVRLGGHLDLAHRIAFNSVRNGHWSCLSIMRFNA